MKIAIMLPLVTSFDPNLTLRLSIQRALLAAVTDRLLRVTCAVKDRHIQIRAYFFGKVTERDTKLVQIVGAEVIADFPDGYTIEEAAVIADGEEPEMLDFWAFRRAGA